LGNEFYLVDFGIRATLNNYAGITIGGVLEEESNTFTNTLAGIMVAHTDPSGTVDIINNEITTTATQGGVGIQLFFNKAESTLKDNIVNVNGTGRGVFLLAANNSILDNNFVYLNNPSLNRSGIELNSGKNNLLQDNTVTGLGITGNDNVGYIINSSPENVLCCNIVDNTRIGLQFNGFCENLNPENNGFFNGTEFGVHDTDFLIEEDGIIGTQNHRQNTWLQLISSALHQGGEAMALQSIFKVDLNINPNFIPADYLPGNWFDLNSTDSGIPVCSPENCMIQSPGIAPETPDALIIANGQVLATNYQPTIQWEAERDLYEKIYGISLTDPDIITFRQNAQSTTVGQFHEISKDIDDLFSADGITLKTIANNLKQIDVLLSSLSNLDLLILSAAPNELDSLLNEKALLLAQIDQYASGNEALIQTVISNRITTAGAIQTDNSNITAIQKFEEYEQGVNNLYLEFLESADYSLSQTDIDLLKVIANQCPIEGGNAVYEARAILAIFNPDDFYDDDQLCNNQAFEAPIIIGQENWVAEGFKVFPNPANTKITVELPELDFKNGEIIVFDIFGKMVLVDQLVENNFTFNLDINNLQDGMYFIQVSLDNNPLEVQKIIVNK
jgi:hypothetical protein